MIAFVLSALCFSLFFFVLLLKQPSGPGKLRGLPTRWQQAVQRSWLTTFLTRLFMMVFPFAVLCIAAGAIHPRYGRIESAYNFVFSPAFLSACCGAAFAAVFVVWTYRLYRVKEHEKLPRILIFEAAFLIIFLVLGCSDVISPYINRLSNVEVSGAKVSFYQIEHRPPTNDPRNVAKVGGQTSAPLRGLDDLANMSSYMVRDNEYLNVLNEGGINEASIFLVKSTFSAIGKCHNAIYKATGSVRFSSQALEGLLPALRSYRTAIEFDGGTDGKPLYERTVQGSAGFLGDVLAKLAERTIDLGIEVEAVPFEAKLKANMAPPDLQKVEDLETECRSLISFPCLHKAFGDSSDGATSQARQDYCSRFCQDVMEDQPKWKPECRDKLATLRPADFSFLYQDMAYSFPYLAKAALQAELGGHRHKPYWSLIYASLAATAGQPDVADQELLHWLKMHDPSTATKAGDGTSETLRFKWYKVRVLSALVGITDEANRASASHNAVRDEFLAEAYQALVKAAGELPFIQDGRKYFRKSMEHDRQDYADLNPHSRSTCLNASSDTEINFQRKITAATTQIDAMINFVDKALDDVDYVKLYSPDVVMYLTELNASDFSCLLLNDSKWERAARIHYAEILRLDAKKAIVEDEELAAGRMAGDRKIALRNAVWALEAARRLVAKDRDKDAEMRKNGDDFFEKTANSEVSDLYGQIMNTLALANTKLDASP